jgi:hypothetical protein
LIVVLEVPVVFAYLMIKALVQAKGQDQERVRNDPLFFVAPNLPGIKVD